MTARQGLPGRLLRTLAGVPLFALGLALTAVALSGLVWVVQLGSWSTTLPASADGIVVFTGGEDRIATGLRLLAEGRGQIMLVSGVGGAAPLRDLLRRSGADTATRRLAPVDRVTLGRAATSTYGNALETADWARAHDVRSLIVVTASYHMARAMLELSRVLPDVALYPVAVRPPSLRGPAQWRLLAEEYAKWLMAWAGLSRLAAPHPVVAAAHRAAPA